MRRTGKRFPVFAIAMTTALLLSACAPHKDRQEKVTAFPGDSTAFNAAIFYYDYSDVYTGGDRLQ